VSYIYHHIYCAWNFVRDWVWWPEWPQQWGTTPAIRARTIVVTTATVRFTLTVVCRRIATWMRVCRQYTPTPNFLTNTVTQMCCASQKRGLTIRPTASTYMWAVSVLRLGLIELKPLGSTREVVCVASLMSVGAIITLLNGLYALRILNFIHFLSTFYLPCELSTIFAVLVYLPPSANHTVVAETITQYMHELDSISLSAPKLLDDFTGCSLQIDIPTYKQCVTCTTRGKKRSTCATVT